MGLFDFLRRKPKSSVRYTGGSGSSKEDAVVISATSSFIGIPAEYAYVEMQCGHQDVDWKKEHQTLMHGPNGKFYDVLTVELKDGSVREFYFDITSFFGKF